MKTSPHPHCLPPHKDKRTSLMFCATFHIQYSSPYGPLTWLCRRQSQTTGRTIHYPWRHSPGHRRGLPCIPRKERLMPTTSRSPTSNYWLWTLCELRPRKWIRRELQEVRLYLLTNVFLTIRSCAISSHDRSEKGNMLIFHRYVLVHRSLKWSQGSLLTIEGQVTAEEAEGVTGIEHNQVSPAHRLTEGTGLTPPHRPFCIYVVAAAAHFLEWWVACPP